MNEAIFLIAVSAYIVLSRLIVRHTSGTYRQILFAAVNIASYFYFFAYGKDPRHLLVFLAYLSLISIQFFIMRVFAEKKDPFWILAFIAPISFLVLTRYTPAAFWALFFPSMRTTLSLNPDFNMAPFFVGISYLTFRASYLIFEVRNHTVKMPNFWEYLGYCMFLPIIPVGPINPYGRHCLAFQPGATEIPFSRSFFRLLIGLVKFKFLGSICSQLTYFNLLLDGHYHHWIDLPVAIIFFYLYLYCNFSGFCDIAIGCAGLIGVPVEENFNNPFAARNIKDFWNRWHITLSTYMRDVVFTPLSKFFVRKVKPENANHAIAATICIVFLLVGIWHGVGWNFVIYGALHALGVVVNHYYAIALKKRLGREGFAAYNKNPIIHSIAVVLTFCYCATTLFFFANTLPECRKILSILQWQ